MRWVAVAAVSTVWLGAAALLLSPALWAQAGPKAVETAFVDDGALASSELSLVTSEAGMRSLKITFPSDRVIDAEAIRVPNPIGPGEAWVFARTATNEYQRIMSEQELLLAPLEDAMRKSLSRAEASNYTWKLRSKVDLPAPTAIDADAFKKPGTIKLQPAMNTTDRTTLWERSLFITSVGLVDSAEAQGSGPLSFGYVMTQLAARNDIDARCFTRDFFRNFGEVRTVNGEVVQPKPAVAALMTKWPVDSTGDLDLARAPFRLLAVVNRFDLRQTSIWGSDRSGGECRLVFGAFDPTTGNPSDPTTGNPIDFSLIFEFKIQATSIDDMRSWMTAWQDLSNFDPALPDYRTKLVALTDQFVKPTPRGDIGQVRTNEIALGGGWELREFMLSPAGSTDGGRLVMTTIKQTPQAALNQNPSLLSWIDSNKQAILDDTAVLPEQLPTGENALAGRIDEPGPVWNQGAAGLVSEVRQAFSLQTCNGCHNAETGTSFFHVRPRARGSETQLSTFMVPGPSGPVVVPDPADPTRHNTFDERQRRLDDFDRLMTFPAFMQINRPRTRMTH
jgi:hypothetical protein